MNSTTELHHYMIAQNLYLQATIEGQTMSRLFKKAATKSGKQGKRNGQKPDTFLDAASKANWTDVLSEAQLANLTEQFPEDANHIAEHFALIPSIADLLRSTPDTERRLDLAPPLLRDTRLKVEQHIKKTYLRQVNTPLGADPVLKCWMELN